MLFFRVCGVRQNLYVHSLYHNPDLDERIFDCLCGCYKMLVFRVCGVRQNLYVFSLDCNPDLDDRIFDCLLASMAAVQTEDIRASL